MRFKISNFSKKSNYLLSKEQIEAQKKRKYRALRSEHYKTLLVKSAKREDFEKIRLHDLFEFAALEEPKAPKKHIFRSAIKSCGAFFKRLGKAFVSGLRFVGNAVILMAKKLVPRRAPRALSLLFGAFCAAITVLALSLFTVGAYLLSGYFMPHGEFVIPDLVGVNLEQATELYENDADFSITYIYSSDYPKDTIISQYPSEGIIKKIYPTSEPCVISLKVSRGARIFEVDDLVGTLERDAIVALRRDEIVTEVIKEFSDTVEAGRIISTSPSKHSTIKAGDKLTLVVSLGKEIKKVTVPDLSNLTESGAKQILEERGFRLGEVTYAASSSPQGRVIAQSVAPDGLLEEGEIINLTVSAGEVFSSRLVPDLYGLTLTEAKEKLREVGLVVGSVFSVSSGAPKGTVIAQSPIPTSVIVSSITSVDIYISS